MGQILNLLNGQEMLNYFKATQFLEGEMMVPFNEAMCYGDTCSTTFSDEFIKMRAKVHQVTIEQYHEITLKPLEPLFCKKFSQLSLWFDADMFCQINILTILAWLDQTNYKDSIKLNFVDSSYKLIEQYVLRAVGYHSIYEQVLINKKYPESNLPTPMQTGIKLYLSYLDKDSDLMRYIQKHHDLSDTELVHQLIQEFKDYGLGDTQYLELIKRCRA